MSKLFFDQVNKIFPSAIRDMKGYSESELRKIEKLYDINIYGEFEEFMLQAGRSDGGVIGDDPLIIYRPTWSVRGQILFQINFFSDLQDIGAWDYLEKPFVFALENENQYYFLQTGSADPMVFHYDANSEIVRRTEATFSEYLVDVLKRYPLGRALCQGELLIV
jgi:hypothetical protein